VDLRPIHRAPAGLAGAFVYRGEMMVVVDLVEVLAGRRCPERLSSRIVMTKIPLGSGATWIVGLLAEQVTEAVHMEQRETGALELAPADAMRHGETTDGGVVRLLSPESFVDPAWRDALSLGFRRAP
jgi:chemotaxis-related protein WspB